MTRTSRFLLQTARWIAGPKRREWIDAMEAETATLETNPTLWALGCIGASLKDRLARDSWFVLAIIFLPLSVLLWKTLVMDSTSWLLVNNWLGAWVTIGLWIFSPFPIALLFGRDRKGTSAYVALVVGFVIAECILPIMMRIGFGIPLLTWFGADTNWYKAGASAAIGPAIGITCDFIVWMMGAWVGMRLGQKVQQPTG
jgi:hypothetical protein